jgi:hypothetical protein
MAEQISVGEVNNKSRNLFLGILFDMIGMLSFTVPFLVSFQMYLGSFSRLLDDLDV